MTKYKLHFEEMLEQNKELFEKFGQIHDNYEQCPEKCQEEFNEKGKIVQDVIRKYENKLCGRSERSVYGKYSSQLSDKFWQLIRARFPKIDFIGVKISQPDFFIKKIKL